MAGGAASWPQAPAGTNRRLYVEDNPIGGVDFAVKTKLLGEIDAYVRAKDPRVRQVMVSLSGSWQAIQILRSEGHRGRRHPPAGAPQRQRRGGGERPHGDRQPWHGRAHRL